MIFPHSQLAKLCLQWWLPADDHCDYNWLPSSLQDFSNGRTLPSNSNPQRNQNNENGTDHGGQIRCICQKKKEKEKQKIPDLHLNFQFWKIKSHLYFGKMIQWFSTKNIVAAIGHPSPIALGTVFDGHPFSITCYMRNNWKIYWTWEWRLLNFNNKKRSAWKCKIIVQIFMF